jgi:hypothetical protein
MSQVLAVQRLTFRFPMIERSSGPVVRSATGHDHAFAEASDCLVGGGSALDDLDLIDGPFVLAVVAGSSK